MTEDEAMALMVDGGFQERSEATEKWSRARLSSTQLCEYYLGSVEMTELEREARRRTEAEGREFAWRPFLESVISHGTPPMPVIRDILFGDGRVGLSRAVGHRAGRAEAVARRPPARAGMALARLCGSIPRRSTWVRLTSSAMRDVLRGQVKQQRGVGLEHAGVAVPDAPAAASMRCTPRP